MECAAAAWRTIGCVKLAKTMQANPVQHGLKFTNSFMYQPLTDEVLNHAPTKPSPIAAILIPGMLTVITHIRKSLAWIQRPIVQADCYLATRLNYVGLHAAQGIL